MVRGGTPSSWSFLITTVKSADPRDYRALDPTRRNPTAIFADGGLFLQVLSIVVGPR